MRGLRPEEGRVMRSTTWLCEGCGNVAKGVGMGADAWPNWCDGCSVSGRPPTGDWRKCIPRSDAEIEREDAILAFADRMVRAQGVDSHDVEAWAVAKTAVLTDLRATLTHLRVLDAKS